jgi:ectoine hydroxylase-related dioxygenase (phytanoyl-CoA dioxygenase family)
MPRVLSAAQVSTYQEQGYLLVSDLLEPGELDELERELDEVFARRQRNAAPLDATWKGDWQGQAAAKTELLHTHDVQAYSAAWARVLTHPRVAAAFADLLGPNVALHHTKAFIKPPEKGSAFPMHQDYPYFPHSLGTMMAGILHVSDATEEMGCLRVYPGTHKRGPLPLANEEQPYIDPEEWPIAGATPVSARRGDIAFFNYLLVHGSDINRAPRVRKTVLIQVRDPADQAVHAYHDRSHAQGLIMFGVNPLAHGERWAAGSGPGE